MADISTFKGGVAVITGAASGIGAGLARKASQLGMKVVLADLDKARLESVAADLSGEYLIVPTDVTDLEAVKALARQSWDRFGQVDLLFNNAGVMTAGLMWEVEPERWQRAFDVNVDGVMNGIRAFIPRMIEAGRPSRIVNTASIGGFLPSPLMAAYTATKAAVVAITESLLGELQIVQAPVAVSLLAPGPVKTGIMDDPFGAIVRPETAGFIELLRNMLNHDGLLPDEFASRVFQGIAQGNYWLFPQPEALDTQFRQRAEMILQHKTPELPKFG